MYHFVAEAARLKIVFACGVCCQIGGGHYKSVPHQRLTPRHTRKAVKEYRKVCSTYMQQVDDTVVDSADRIIARAKLTEVEGLLVFIFNTVNPNNKLEIRTKVQTQVSTLQRLDNWEDTIHPRLLKRIKDALVFR